MTRDPVVVLLFRIVVAAVAIVVLATTYADPDLWGHVLFGRDIVSARSIPSADPYSFTSDRVWVNHEWLSEVVMATAYRAGGTAGLIGLRIALLGTALFIAFRSLGHRATGVIRDAILLFLILGTAWVTVSVRPQLFSVLLYVSLLASIVRLEEDHRSAVVWWPVIMLVWVNVHGGWVVGLGMLSIWAVFAVARLRSMRERTTVGVGLCAAILATLVNPYGWGIWQFVGETVRLGRDIQEWQPITSHPLSHLALWVTSLAIGAIGFVRSRADARWAHAAMAALLAFASWRVARLDAFFCVTVAMLLATYLASPSASPSFRNLRGRDPVWVVIAVAGVVILGAAVLRAQSRIGCIEIESEWPPDAAAGEFIRGQRLQGRMLTWFDWGEYAIWHFAPGVKVSIDGRRETVYSEAMTAAHFRFYADADRGDLVRVLAPDYIWLPRTLPVIPRLIGLGWMPLFESQRSIVFARATEKGYRDDTGVPPTRRCFPGP